MSRLPPLLRTPRARAKRPQAQTYTCFKSVSVSLAQRQEGSRGENVKKSLGNTSRKNAFSSSVTSAIAFTASIAASTASAIGLRLVKGSVPWWAVKLLVRGL